MIYNKKLSIASTSSILAFSLIILVISKIIIYRKNYYISPEYIDKDCKEFKKIYNIKELPNFGILTWYIPERVQNYNPIYYTNLKKIIVFCHGNSYNITWKTKILKSLSDNFYYPIIIQDYLRIDNTESNIDKMINKTNELINYLINNGYTRDNIILFGESMGCAVALEVAQKNNIKNIISYIGFRRIKDLIIKMIPILGGIVGVFTSELDNYKIIKNNNFNITLLNSPNDKVVIFDNIQNMAKDLNIELLQIDGSHKYPIIFPHVFSRLKEKYFI